MKALPNYNHATINEIPLLEWDSILEKYEVDIKNVQRDLKKTNHANNFWYPYDWSLDEKEIMKVVEMFQLKFPDAEIKSLHNYKYIELFLNTLEKHQFVYTLLYLLNS